ncbi:MAG: MFS transporter [Candidatus Midichloriaceae bacterium]
MATKLTRQQKEAIALLLFGTLLEYFDLMLYVHLSVLLNELFFPKTDPMMAKLLAVTAFCMTFVLRPVGGYVIGRMRDAIGRKATIFITTFIMAGTCLTMGLFPTYEEVGIWATVVILLCRMLQGFSSLGEIIGACVYLAETLQSPHKYIAGGIEDTASRVGGLFALGVASLVLNSNFNWRVAFFINAGVAVVGMVARTNLRETPEFANYQSRMKILNKLDQRYVVKEKINKKALVGLFFNVILAPICFYCTYIYLSHFMKSNLGMLPEEVVTHNLKVSVYSILSSALMTYLCGKIYPIKIIKISVLVGVATALYIPYCLNEMVLLNGELVIYFLQCAIYIPALSHLINAVYMVKTFSCIYEIHKSCHHLWNIKCF